MRDTIIVAMLPLALLIASGCADSGTTTVDIETEARVTASRGPTPTATRGPSASRIEASRAREAEREHEPEPASLAAEQTELRAAIADLEIELRLTAEAANDMGEDFEEAMESIEAELEDRRMQLAIISGCPEQAETTDECPAFGA